jgi:hypothetical protein
MIASHAMFQFLYYWLTAPLLAAVCVYGIMNLLFDEFLVFEAMAGYGIGLFNFTWSRLLFKKIQGFSFDVFMRGFFFWGGIKTVIVLVVACLVLSLLDVDHINFIVSLLIAYSIFGLIGTYEIINRSNVDKS